MDWKWKQVDGLAFGGSTQNTWVRFGDFIYGIFVHLAEQIELFVSSMTLKNSTNDKGASSC